MGLQDRDYMRRPYPDEPEESYRQPRRGWGSFLAVATAVIGLASAGVWLFRDAQTLVGSSSPEEGSLVVNINTATQEQLETIPGIGPARAAQIIAGRPYRTVDELEKIPGIGPAQVDSIRPYVMAIGGAPELQ